MVFFGLVDAEEGEEVADGSGGWGREVEKFCFFFCDLFVICRFWSSFRLPLSWLSGGGVARSDLPLKGLEVGGLVEDDVGVGGRVGNHDVVVLGQR